MIKMSAAVDNRTTLLIVFVLVMSATLVFSFSAKSAEDTDQAKIETNNELDVDQDNDPLEGLNRFTSGFNSIFRNIILDPLVSGYQAVTPEPIQDGLSNAASNLTEPVTAISSLLEGDIDNASIATQRFFVNSTVGIGGLSDLAKDEGLVQRREDLGQAAATAGADGGFYLVLPILGPSNSRDALGTAVTTAVNPLPFVVGAATSGIEYSENRDVINDLTKGSLDPYVVEREAYRQMRQDMIMNGEVELPEAPTLD